jgi:hypothetical protein
MKETTMRKYHVALLAGAVVVGLGAVMGLAAFAPSLAGSKTGKHELTLQLPRGGTEIITYSGDAAPRVSFHSQRLATLWPAPISYIWSAPSFVALDPVIADMSRQLNMLASTPLLIPPVIDQPLSAATLSNLPPGTSYSMVSETTGNGVCTHFTQITKAAGDTKPKIVSQSSGDCGTDATQAGETQPTQGAKTINLRTTTRPAVTQSM